MYCDGDIMKDKLDYNFVYSRRIKLTDASIEKAKSVIMNRYGVEVLRVVENENGYVFYGEYDVSIGDVTYDSISGKYKGLNYHGGAVEEIERRRKIEAHKKQVAEQSRKNAVNAKRKLKLKRKRFGVAITSVGLAVLISLGVVHAMNKNTTDNQPYVSVEQVNTVASANDLILNAWANYAIGLVTEAGYNSEYEYVQSVADNLKNEFYNKAMLAYYNYIDQKESDLPVELIGNASTNNHNEFRRDCYLLDEALEESFFNYATFDDSPYADAVVYDSNGNLVTDGAILGECYDSNGNLLLPGSEYTVYIKALDVPGNDYSITNLPEDAVFYNNVIYVAEDHLNDFSVENNKTK